jgi:hypothetical protein
MRASRTSATSPAYCGSARTAIEPPRRVAQAFADYLNSVLNRTVTDARLSPVPIPGGETRYSLARFQNQERTPLALHGVGERLFVQQAIEVVGDHCQTVSYAYRFQTADDVWLLRWEFPGERPRADYASPLAHLHVNAAFV